MIKPSNLADYEVSFRAEQSKQKKTVEEKTRILPNTPQTRLKQGFQKTSSAFIDYPIKGLKGDINSNFYEFLTMGTVPYLAGSAMFMLAFNAVNEHLLPKSRKMARDTGYKMALGVILYGVFKSLSKNLVTKPVKAATGVDTEMPYENIVYPLPKKAGEAANIEVQHQQRKVYDSKEFFRKDLLDRAYFDKVAKKLGLGDNLNDSISETTPIIQNIVATTGTAKSISSYCWAGLGVCLAVQDAWNGFFDAFRNRNKYIKPKNASFFEKFVGFNRNMLKNTYEFTKEFFRTAGLASKQLWQGKPGTKGYMKNAGKVYIIATALITTILTSNAILRAKNLAKNKNISTIDKTKESTVI